MLLSAPLAPLRSLLTLLFMIITALLGMQVGGPPYVRKPSRSPVVS
jgi:hypothetical protein